MKIGFIGYGSMADALAGKWRNKHAVLVGGRDHAKAAALAAKHGAESGDGAAAARFGEVVVLATPADAALDAVAAAGGPDAFAGKVVLDINNPLDTQTFRTTLPGGGSLTEVLAEALPGAHLAKAFNMCQAKVWARDDMTFDGRTLVTLFTADDPSAIAHTAELIRDVGSEPLHLGGNAHAAQLEAAAAMVIKFLFAGRDPLTVLNFIQPEVKPVA